MRLAYQFQGQKVKDQGTPGPLMLTHIVRHIFRTTRPTNFKLGTRMEDDDPHQPQAHDRQGQRSRSQGHVICLSQPSWPNAVPVPLEAGGGILCWPNPAATLLVNDCYADLPGNTVTQRSPSARPSVPCLHAPIQLREVTENFNLTKM